jgi:hypothetical protein
VHVVLYDRDPVAKFALVSQPLEDPLGGMLLLGRLTLIFHQDPINVPEEGIQLRPAPLWPRARAIVRPMPAPAPVTSATFPSIRMSMVNAKELLARPPRHISDIVGVVEYYDLRTYGDADDAE